MQVLNVPFDIWLNSFFGLTYTCYETVKTYHFFFKLVNKSSFIGRHKKLVRMKINYNYIYKNFQYYNNIKQIQITITFKEGHEVEKNIQVTKKKTMNFFRIGPLTLSCQMSTKNNQSHSV